MEEKNIVNQSNESSDQVIFINHNNRVEEIILNYPKKLNVVNLEMAKSITERVVNYVSKEIIEKEKIKTKYLKESDLEQLKKNQNPNLTEVASKTTPYIVIIKGQGDKSFCAGGDITRIHNDAKSGHKERVLEFYDYEILGDLYLQKMNPVLISVWNGYVMGGGLGLSVNAPIRIATDNTMFAMPETTIGLYPDVGAAFFLPRIFQNHNGNIPQIGLFCGLTGYRVEGSLCAVTGVATHYIKKENLAKAYEVLISSFSNLSNQELLQLSREETVNKVNELLSPFTEIKYSPANFSFPNMDLIEKVFKFDSIINIFTRLEEMVKSEVEEDSKWAQNTLNKLNSLCPYSLFIFFEFAKRALNYDSISEAYNMDLNIFKYILYNENDFFEGIRALLIDRDKNPQWKYKSIKEITNPEEILTNVFEKEH